MSTKTKTLLALSAMLLATILTASAATAQPERFVEISYGDGELVIRLPQKARVGKNFNIGIYVADSLVGGKDWESAKLYISVSGPEYSTCDMWNDWFEAQEQTIDENDDLIVAPHEGIYYSMEHDEAVSKLGDVAGWTGSVVCRADTAGKYTFTLKNATAIIGTFIVTVG